MNNSSEWLRLMLDEIARKKAEQQADADEIQRRQQAGADTPAE